MSSSRASEIAFGAVTIALDGAWVAAAFAAGAAGRAGRASGSAAGAAGRAGRASESAAAAARPRGGAAASGRSSLLWLILKERRPPSPGTLGGSAGWGSLTDRGAHGIVVG
jgi:hypothetical protein